mgnify:CR=1 FL=1
MSRSAESLCKKAAAARIGRLHPVALMILGDALQFSSWLGMEPLVTETASTEDEDKLTGQQVNKMNALITLYKEGPGASLASANGTWWGALNAVTHYVDHQASARDTTGDGVGASRFASAQFGTGAAMKNNALELAMKAACVPESMLVAA